MQQITKCGPEIAGPGFCSNIVMKSNHEIASMRHAFLLLAKTETILLEKRTSQLN